MNPQNHERADVYLGDKSHGVFRAYLHPSDLEEGPNSIVDPLLCRSEAERFAKDVDWAEFVDGALVLTLDGELARREPVDGLFPVSLWIPAGGNALLWFVDY